MKKLILFIYLLIYSSSALAQPMENGDFLYDNFEYSDASLEYEKARDLGVLDEKHAVKLAFCYFVDNNAPLGFHLCDSLLKMGVNEIELNYWKAHFERELTNYDAAINSADKYLALGGKNLPLKFKESCYMLQNTPEIIEGSTTPFIQNDKKANIVQFIGKEPIYFYENGLDSLGQDIGFADGKGLQAEALLMRPYLMKNGNLKEWEIIHENGKTLTISSIQFDSIRNEVFFSAAFPINNDVIAGTPHIYTAKISTLGETITTFKPWKYAGFEDTSACSHIAMTSDGENMVFSKLTSVKKDADLYFSHRIGTDWSTPIPIPEINTLGNELFPTFIGDTLFSFSSDGIIGYGGIDIFYFPFDPEWKSVEQVLRMPLPINSTRDDFWMNQISKDSIVLNSNRLGGSGDDDVWSFNVPIKIPEPEIVLEPVLPIFDIDSFLRVCNSKRIYFGFNEGMTIQEFDFIPKLRELIDQGYKFSILITGYADARGTTQINYNVGMNRAESTKKNLISRGIQSDIMKAISMGSSKIENKCKTSKIPCSEKEHQPNRYVQLTISRVN